MEQVFRALCEVAVEEDGLTFLGDTVRGEVIGEADEYRGLRMTLTASLGKAIIPIQVSPVQAGESFRSSWPAGGPWRASVA